MFSKTNLLMVGLVSLVWLSCGKDDSDSTPSNVNLTGDYEGAAIIDYGAYDTTFDVTVSAAVISGTKYSLSTIDGEFAQVTVVGSAFKGSGADVSDLTGKLSGSVLSFTGNTSDGGVLSFTGTKIPTGSGNYGNINIDGRSGSRESASCAYGAIDTYNYKLSNGESASMEFEYYDDTKKDAGSYTIQTEVGETDNMAALVFLTLYDSQDNPYAKYQARSGSFSISYQGSNMTHTFSSITFDFDSYSDTTLSATVHVSGFGVWTPDDN